MLLHDTAGDSELVQLKQGLVAWNPPCVKLCLHYLWGIQEVSSCYAHSWGGLSMVPGMTKVPLEEVMLKLIMKYGPEDPVLGQPVRKVGMRHDLFQDGS